MGPGIFSGSAKPSLATKPGSIYMEHSPRPEGKVWQRTWIWGADGKWVPLDAGCLVDPADFNDDLDSEYWGE